MKKSEFKKLEQVVNNLDWSMSYDDGEFTFSKFSPAGQDFNIELSADDLEELSEKLHERYNYFDCSEETYLWLDNTGHGIKGAPYDMKDLYEDMEACEEMIRELAVGVQNIL